MSAQGAQDERRISVGVPSPATQRAPVVGNRQTEDTWGGEAMQKMGERRTLGAQYATMPDLPLVQAAVHAVCGTWEALVHRSCQPLSAVRALVCGAGVLEATC